MLSKQEKVKIVTPDTPPPPIRLYLVDDHALFREGLGRLLAADPQIELAGTTADPAVVLAALQRQSVDVLLLDYDLGAHSAEDLVKGVRESGFSGRILLVTAGLPDRVLASMPATTP